VAVIVEEGSNSRLYSRAFLYLAYIMSVETAYISL
jgi:hypothetical protein